MPPQFKRANSDRTETSELTLEKHMNRNLVKGTAVVALMLGASLAFSSSASAFKFLRSNNCCNSGGLFSGLKAHKCGGGLLAKLKANDCCAPEPCCEPAPAPCCEPAPAPCCEAAPAPAPCCGETVAAPVVEAAPCCGDEMAPMMEAPMMHSEMGTSVMESSQGFDLAPGETLVPGSVSTGAAAAAAATTEEAAPAAPAAPVADDAADASTGEEAAPPAPAAEEAPAAEAPAAEAPAEEAPAAEEAAPAADEVKSSSDQAEEAAPPVPQPDANTDI